MRRTQLYLEDDLWTTLHNLARSEQLTVSELVRRAVRECYLRDGEARRDAMVNFVGIRSDIDDHVDSTEYIRTLRQDSRMARIRDPQ